MSLTSAGTALNGLSAGGRSAGSAGSGGISITLRTDQLPSSARFQRQMEAVGGLVGATTPTEALGLGGLGGGGGSRDLFGSRARASGGGGRPFARGPQG